MNIYALPTQTLMACIIGAAALTSADTAAAHHSFALYDRDTKITLTGTVSAFEWVNPHVAVKLLAAEQDGSTTEWTIEGAGTGVLRRKNWSAQSLQIGDKVTALISPLRDGRKGGSLVSVRKADGTVLEE